MRLTGESPSPTETCDGRVLDRYCAAVRRGGELREGNCSAQKCLPRRLNSLRFLYQASLPSNGEAGSARVSMASTNRVRARTIDDTGMIGVGGTGRFINGPLRAVLVLDRSSTAVRVSIVALEHGKAV